MRSVADLVYHHPLFAGLPEEDIEPVARCARNVAFRPGQLLLREGTAADTFYLLRRGRVAIEVHSPAGGPIVIETVGPGGCVGWSWLFPPYRCHFDARALGEVGAIAVDGACLRGKAEAEPRLGYALASRVSAVLLERLQATRVRLLDLYGGDRGR
ncbi:MAG TPA: cyclic nucleotide-binding domain-containing protein [Acidimicrobiales bacterium]|nr:cyclic nucleotide-binding domain-containing protein [Acidimicrobiales bacterium]